MDKTPLKPVPGFDSLFISYDGSIIWHNDRLKRVCYCLNKKNNGKKYKIVYIGRKYYFISRLVFAAWIGELPRNRKIEFKNGNHLDTNYKNLMPLKHNTTFPIGQLKKVRGYDEVYINANGTYLIQYGFQINIKAIEENRNNKLIQYFAGCVYTGNSTKWIYINRLVYSAFVGHIPRNKVIQHIDRNPKNNHYTNLKAVTPKQLIRERITLKPRYSSIDKKHHPAILEALAYFDDDKYNMIVDAIEKLHVLREDKKLRQEKRNDL